MPSEAIVVDFLSHLRAERNYSIHTVKAYGRDLDQFRQLFTADWESLDLPALRSVMAHLARQGLHPRSIRRLLSAVRSFARWAKREGRLSRNVAVGVRGPKTDRPLPGSLQVDTATQIMDAFGSDLMDLRDKAIVELFYSSGLRLSELVGLDLPNLDLVGAQVRVLGKGKRERILPVGRHARDALEKWLAGRSEWAAPEQTAVFVSRRGQRLGPRGIQARVRLIGIRAGIGERLHPHRLRHAFASHLLESSGDLRAVQELLGHADLATTQIYTHLDFQHLAQTYDKAHPRARRRSHPA
jgi:integrase/recombinase XerC